MMNDDEKREINIKREYLVVKANELIQKNRFKLSLVQQKAVAYICSMIKPATEGEYNLEYEFRIRDYCKICGIDYDAGKNYARIKSSLKNLGDKSMWMEQDNGDEVLVRWLKDIKISKRSGNIKIKLDDYLIPYLFNLKEKFTQYSLYYILRMQSAYSIRIYELLKSHAFQKSKTFDLEQLKKVLMVDDIKKYRNFYNFKVQVLDIAQREINQYTDINIYYEAITKGRRVEKIRFKIDEKGIIEKGSVIDKIFRDLNKRIDEE